MSESRFLSCRPISFFGAEDGLISQLLLDQLSKRGFSSTIKEAIIDNNCSARGFFLSLQGDPYTRFLNCDALNFGAPLAGLALL